ncbi:MAG: restriction endonuclease subunit S [Isosphaeraceae bacterium]
MNNGWKKMKLSQVCEKITDGTHQTPTYFDEGFLFLSSRNVTTGRIDWDNVKYIDSKQHLDMQRRVSPRMNDILLAKNGTTGVAAIVDRDVAFDIYVSPALLRPLETVLPAFLLHFINSPLAKQQFTKRLKGIGVPNLHLEEIREVEISFPVSIPEQQRIVGILDEAFDGIATAKANAEKNLQNARALFESHLQAVFTQRGEGWVDQRLGELATFRNGINFTKSSRGESVRIVGVKDFQNNYWAPLDCLDTVTPEGTLPDSDTLKENDLLFVRSNGNMELIGRCLLVGPVAEKITHSGFTIRARLNSRGVMPKYLCHVLKSNDARREMIASGIGTNIKSLNQPTLGALVVPLPSIAEQGRIVDQLEALKTESQRLESLYQQKLDALDELKKSLLHQAFIGKL